ncbi:restriction endonuclease [Clostridium bowmanii]|uniref:restriction endonuclease n=1 Tax=Clostridium bowmanii TaxID=132925 RepID=UPI001C0BA181|nr:restriction endonuclease [Clostridium bowmanii]MBU3190157.1 restriction endonuclease [Clostridium bowmanii]MCA1074753.1 restriction endonuclease [Clostridium bowmanii]
MEQIEYATIDKDLYKQKTIIKRIEALFLNNVGKIVTNTQLVEVAKDPITGKEPENWHQRLSELRTNYGYTILSQRDRCGLKLGEYLLVSIEKREKINKRVYPSKECWKKILKRANNCCEWSEGGVICDLKEGDIDPIGGGKVKLTADHLQPHSYGQVVDMDNPDDWQALCGRHQVVKKNFWNNKTGKLNIKAILQSVTVKEKEEAYNFLKDYFKE